MKFFFSWLVVLWSVAFVAKAQPVADFSATITTGCAPILVQFNDLSTGNPTSWQWNLGNSTTSNLQNPSTTYFNPGTYTVTLTVSNASGSDTKTMVGYITVVAPPDVQFAADDSSISCSPKTVQFTDLSNLNAPGTGTYFWDFGDGNTSSLQSPVHTYSSTGNFSVTLSVTNSSGCSRILTKQNYIQLVPDPVASFSTPVTGACAAPLTVNFTNTSTGATSFLWDFGNGNTSTAANPTATYNALGSYDVMLVAMNGNCRDTLIQPSYISIGSPSASFVMSSPNVCTGNTVLFTNTSTPGPGNSIWDFGDGTTTTGANASHSYTSPGTYTVTLIVQYNNCSDTATQTITVTQGPNVTFSANQTSSCSPPFTVQFSSTGTGISSYLWDFGDGSTSTAANPSHTYTAFGSYTVSLTAVSVNGCSTTVVMPNYISVYQVNMNITANPPGGCVPATIQFTATTTPNVPITSYVWNFGDGTVVAGGATATHTYTTVGNFTVTVDFITSQGCSFTSNPLNMPVGEAVSAGFTASPLQICPLGTVTFTNTSTAPPGSAYEWFFGDGGTSTDPNPMHTYNNQGTYTVILIVYNGGCSDIEVITNMITVNPPSADFDLDYSCTNKHEVSFIDASSGAAQWDWDFGDGNTSSLQNPVHVYGSLGNYQVTLTVTHQPSGCVSTHQKTINLFDVDGNFTANDTVLCKGESVQFTASVQPSNRVVGYNWYFGDGTNSLNAGPVATHIYNTGGVYTVTLVTLDQHNCRDTFIKTNYITVNAPASDFTATPVSGCSPLAVNFSDQSNGNGATITSRIWRFGDGTNLTTGNQTTPSHVYANNGLYSVRLVVEDANGCRDSILKTNYIQVTRPTANFTASDTNVCPGDTISFINTSTGTSLTYAWDFGDGFTSTATNPVHVYTSSGTYTVRLIVTDATSCTDTLVRTAYINASTIQIGFIASDTFAACPPLTINFTNTSSGASTYTWDFGNGNSSSIFSPSTVYTFPGVYTVKLKGMNGAGCRDSAIKTVTVLGPTGTLSYSPLSGCSPLTIQFSSQNSNTQTLIWDMDNGFTQSTTTSTYTYTYTSPGIYIPRLLLSDGVSCVVPIIGSDTIRVEELDIDFSFSPNNLCQSGTVNFMDTVLSAVSQVVFWSWDFGDGGTASIHNPSHTYASPGTYTVTLVMGTALNCYDTVVKTVTIFTPPTVSAGPDQDFCQSLNINAQLQATGAQTYTWSPAGGLSCTTCPNPIASPTVTTTYTVVGTDVNGCTDTSEVTIQIHPLPTINTGSSSTICEGASIQLTATGANTYVWSPGTGLSCTNCQNPTASPASTTTYTVTGTDAMGCENTAQVTVTVTPLPTVSVSGAGPICVGDSVQLLATGADTYSWIPATDLSCTNCDNPFAYPTVTTTYSLAGANAGCTDTTQVTIIVNPLPTVSGGGPYDVCIANTVQLQATGADDYVWDPSTGLSCTTCPNPVANLTSNQTYVVTGTDANGCSQTASVVVSVHAIPNVSVSPDQTICLGQSANLQASGADTYIWSPSAGLSCTNCSNPSASPTATTTYVVTGSDAFGCSDTAVVTVFVNPLPDVDAGPDVSICSLNNTQLQVTGAISYSWQPTAGLSCTTCPDPIASPSVTTTYTVTGIDTNGCTNTDEVVVSLYPQPPVNAGPDVVICQGQTTQLTATGAQMYYWEPSTALSCVNCPNPIAAPSTDITYTVKGIDANGCHDSDRVTITVIQMEPFVIGDGDTICQGESTKLSVAGGDSYLWTPATGLDNPTSATPTATPDITTEYTVIIKQGDCFSDTAYITVFVYPMPNVNAGNDQKIIAGNSAQLFAVINNANNYLWEPAESLNCSDCQSPIATPGQTTTYKITVSNDFGCMADDEVTVFVQCDNSTLYFANTFTPNGDGNNDRFYPQGKGISEVKRFRIFNRWGELVFEAQNISLNNELQGWDGTYKGTPLTPDVYVYIVDAVCTTGEPMQLKGDISLIR